MQDRRDWEELRTCDAIVESLIVDGAYQEALDHLVRGYQQVVISFCRAQLGSAGQGGRAEEVAQEVFLAVYQNMPRFQRRAPIHKWLFGIARKQCLQEWRNYRRRGQRLEEHRDTVAESVHQSDAIPTEERLMSEEELERLRSSLNKLRKWERELLTKRFCEGYTIAMLAQETTFWSESTVRNRLTQALERLRNIYRRDLVSEG